MKVSVSPDGKMLAMDLQGSIYVLPVAGGTAKRVTDIFDDAREPQWAPDSKSIVFSGYRDGGYDLWEVGADGGNQHMLTEGTFDDREPIFSHDGRRIAFSSDRGNPLGSDNNIWVLDVRSGALSELTTNPAEDTMPSWSPDDKEIAFISSRDTYKSAWAVNVATKVERRVADVSEGKIDAVSYRAAIRFWTSSAMTANSIWTTILTTEVVFPFRPVGFATNFLYGGWQASAVPWQRREDSLHCNLESRPQIPTCASVISRSDAAPVLGLGAQCYHQWKTIAFARWCLAALHRRQASNLTNDALALIYVVA